MNEISKAASLMSARGASKGGKARAESLTAFQRRKIAKAAAAARWKTSELITTPIPVMHESEGDGDEDQKQAHECSLLNIT